MLVIVALLSLGICSMNMESFKNHSMHKDWSEKEYMVKYEEEDPYLVAQNNNTERIQFLTVRMFPGLLSNRRWSCFLCC